MLNKAIKYESKIYKLIDRYEMFLVKTTGKYENIIFRITKGFKWIVYKLIEIIDRFSRLLRYLTYPTHWIYLYIAQFRYKRIERIEDMPNFKVGTHYVYGLPGEGKSTFSYHSSIEYAFHTGKTSYTTVMMETPRTNIRGMKYYYHQYVSPEDFFGDGKQIARFNTKLHNMFIYEEMLADGKHQRNNRRRNYNDVILPMISSNATQRHQGMDLFYYISQLPRGDISIMHMLAGYHHPRIKKGFDYRHWLNTGKFRLKIKGWRMTSYQVEPTSGNDYKLTNKRRWFYKCKYPEEMEYFNRLNMENHYDDLPIHKGSEMK